MTCKSDGCPDTLQTLFSAPLTARMVLAAGIEPAAISYTKKYPGKMPGYVIGGGGGTACPYLSKRAGLYLHPVARMRSVLFAAQ